MLLISDWHPHKSDTSVPDMHAELVVFGHICSCLVIFCQSIHRCTLEWLLLMLLLLILMLLLLLLLLLLL